RVVLVELLALEQGVDDPIDVLRDRALLGARFLRLLLEQRLERGEDLLRCGRHVLELARGELAVLADRRVADELANLLRVLRRDLRDELREHLPRELARLLERWHGLLFGPVREASCPEVVVLVEALVPALGEVVAA